MLIWVLLIHFFYWEIFRSSSTTVGPLNIPVFHKNLIISRGLIGPSQNFNFFYIKWSSFDSFCLTWIHNNLHGSAFRSRYEPSSLPPHLPSSFTLNLSRLLPHTSSLIHHPSSLTLQPLNSPPSYLFRLPSFLNNAPSPLLPHH